LAFPFLKIFEPDISKKIEISFLQCLGGKDGTPPWDARLGFDRPL
jgi:hypothetical protein